MQKSYSILLVILLMSHPATAQTGTCEPAFAEAYLDAGNVRGHAFSTTADFFWRGCAAMFMKYPKARINSASFNANGIWVGGLINDSLRVAATRYGPLGILGWPAG